jgi:hypothetical protein
LCKAFYRFFAFFQVKEVFGKKLVCVLPNSMIVALKRAFDFLPIFCLLPGESATGVLWISTALSGYWQL